MRYINLIVMSLLGLFSCKSTSYTPTDYPKAMVTFGSGGGFTGITTEYTLLENGQLFRKSSNEKEHTAVKSVDKNKTAQIFENIKTLKIANMKFNHAGNMNTYLTTKFDGVENKINWGQPGPPPPKDAKLMYSILMNLIKNNK